MSWRGIIDVGPQFLCGEEIFHVTPIGVGPKGWFCKSELMPVQSHTMRNLSSSDSNDDMDSDAEGKRKDSDDNHSPEHDTDDDDDGYDPTNVSDLFDPMYQSHSIFDQAADMDDMFDSDVFQRLVELCAAQVLVQYNAEIDAVGDEISATSVQNANTVSAQSSNANQSALATRALESSPSKETTAARDAAHDVPDVEYDSPDAAHAAVDAVDVEDDTTDDTHDTSDAENYASGAPANAATAGIMPLVEERSTGMSSASKPESELSRKLYLYETERDMSGMKMLMEEVDDDEDYHKNRELAHMKVSGGRCFAAHKRNIHNILFRIVSEKNTNNFYTWLI